MPKPSSAKKPEVTRRVPPAPDNSLKRILAIGLMGLLALGLVWAIVFTLKDDAKTPTESPSPTSAPTKVVKEQRSVTGKSLEEDKKAAVAALNNILKTADKSPTGVAAAVRLQTLNKDDYSVIDPALPGLIHYGPDSTAGLKTSTYQSLVTLSTIVKEKNGGKLEPISEEAWKTTFGDPQLGTVFVPLNIYAGQGAAFSLEMVYVNGSWKLSPYSLIDAIRLSAMLGSQAKVGS